MHNHLNAHSHWATVVRTTLLAIVISCTFKAVAAQTCRQASLVRTGVTADERVQILETHNRLRSQVAQGTVPNQPGAQNMQEMVWDEELAYKAQQWANQCTFEHDPSRYLDRFTMGQNLARIWSTIPLADNDGDFPSRIQKWFNEVQKYAWGAQWSEATGHYSQLVWGDTNLIGCGFAYYKDAHRFNKLWVCNYGPGGNVEGSQPYEVGNPACSNYGMQSSSRYSGLCYNYGNTAHSNYNNDNNNYIENTFTIQTETFNAPTYQLHSSQPSAPAIQQPPPQPPQAILQNVFKPIVQAVVQPVNNLIKTDYSFKSIFDRFKGALNLQRVSPPQSEPNPSHTYEYYQQPESQLQQQQPQQPLSHPNQYIAYQPQPPPQQSTDYTHGYGSQANVYNAPPPPSPSYQHQSNIYQQPQTHSYSVATSNSYQVPPPNYREPQPSYHHEPPPQPSYQPHYQTHQQYYQTAQQQSTSSHQPTSNRNNPFLTYDWSQLFNRNRK